VYNYWRETMDLTKAYASWQKNPDDCIKRRKPKRWELKLKLNELKKQKEKK
tara:strand:- start:331 stop:483 length:153 start_codon:yes stop_codon:yes gene_type:complete